jgi:hypothetical protein
VALMQSPTRRAIKRAVNAILDASRMGDTLKIEATL